MNNGTVFHQRYRIVKKLGVGGFSEVFLVHDLKTDVHLALKLFNKQDEEGIALSREEFKKSYSFRHPYILRPAHFDVCDQRPYLIMPYASGGSLNDFKEQMDFQLFKKVFFQIGEALAYLHSKNPSICHNDIKPDNILIDENGDFMLSDFGISNKLKDKLTKTLNAKDQLTQTYSGATPLAFRAPDLFQFRNWSSKGTSPKSDVWSFCTTLYYAYFGVLPFNGEGGLGQLILSQSQDLNLLEILKINIDKNLNQDEQHLLNVLSQGLILDPSLRPEIDDLKKLILRKPEPILHEINPIPKIVPPSKNSESKEDYKKYMFWAIPFFIVITVLFYFANKVSHAKYASSKYNSSLALDTTSKTTINSPAIKRSDSTQISILLEKDTAFLADGLLSELNHNSKTSQTANRKEIQDNSPQLYPSSNSDKNPEFSVSQPPKRTAPIQEKENNTSQSKENIRALQSLPLEADPLEADPLEVISNSEVETAKKPIDKSNKEEKKTPSKESIESKLAWTTYNVQIPLVLKTSLKSDQEFNKGDEIFLYSAVDVISDKQIIIPQGTKTKATVIRNTKKKLVLKIDQIHSGGGDPIELYRSTYELQQKDGYYALQNEIFFAFINEQKQVKIN